MHKKLQLENLIFELKRLEDEYYNLNKKTFLAVLYYTTTIKRIKKDIVKLKKAIGE